ncbi:MAG: C69 family dipeptidase [Sporomusaceae bacterium]|nr:C69 family dipeptidase [Sporomusaceae bacterium]
MKTATSYYRTFLSVFSIVITCFITLGTSVQQAWAADNQVRPTAVVERCSSIIIGKQATKDGSTLLAHNEDLTNYCAQHYVYIPHAKHESGDIITTFWGAKIPQVAETYGYSATKIFDKAYSPGDITSGVNEHQVAVANNMSYRRDAPTELPTTGRIIWTELTQLALERAKTAREAVEVIGDLVHTYKLGSDSGAIFAVTDGNEGWWVEVTLEGQWVAQRVPNDSFGVRANIFRIGQIDFANPDNFMYSSDVVDYAKKMGWYDGKEPFNFAKVYAAPEKLNDPYNTRRQWRAEELLKEQIATITPIDIIRILRDHYEGTPYDLTNGYKKGSPHQTDERTLCSINTEISLVCQSRPWLPSEIGAVTWRAMATPCTSVFTPWYFGNSEIPAAFQTGTNQYSPNSAYWTFRDLSRYADVRYQNVIGNIHRQIDFFEKKEFTAQDDLEKEALQIYGQDKKQAIQFLGNYTNNLAEQSLKLGNSLLNQ